MRLRLAASYGPRGIRLRLLEAGRVVRMSVRKAPTLPVISFGSSRGKLTAEPPPRP